MPVAKSYHNTVRQNTEGSPHQRHTYLSHTGTCFVEVGLMFVQLYALTPGQLLCQAILTKAVRHSKQCLLRAQRQNAPLMLQCMPYKLLHVDVPYHHGCMQDDMKYGLWYHPGRGCTCSGAQASHSHYKCQSCRSRPSGSTQCRCSGFCIGSVSVYWAGLAATACNLDCQAVCMHCMDGNRVLQCWHGAGGVWGNM